MLVFSTCGARAWFKIGSRLWVPCFFVLQAWCAGRWLSILRSSDLVLKRALFGDPSPSWILYGRPLCESIVLVEAIVEGFIVTLLSAIGAAARAFGHHMCSCQSRGLGFLAC